MRTAIAAVLIISLPVHAAPPKSPADPVVLFEGRTTGAGDLRILLGRTRAFRVQSVGRLLPDGSFRLDQRIEFEGEPPRERHWILRATTPGRYAFSLSDATGSGTAAVDRDRLVLRYPLGRGLSMRQVLEPSNDGSTIANVGRLRWLGIPIGRLDETIRRDAPQEAANAR